VQQNDETKRSSKEYASRSLVTAVRVTYDLRAGGRSPNDFATSRASNAYGRARRPSGGHADRADTGRWSRAPDRGHPTHKPLRPRPERQRHLHRAFLVRLEGDLLGQHNIPGRKKSFRREAPAAEGAALFIQLVHVLLGA